MTPALRLLAAGGGAGLNAVILLAPAALLGYQPLRNTVLVAAVTAVSSAVATEIFCWLSVSAPVEPAGKTDLDWLNWTQGLALLGGFEIDIVWHMAHPHSVVAWLVCGLALLAIGAGLRAAAILQLGVGFTNAAAPGNAALCVDGIYRWLRHPGEVGLCLTVVGFALALQVWAVAAVTLPLFLVLSLVRVACEERGLERRFPEDFAAYRRRVRF